MRTVIFAVFAVLFVAGFAIAEDWEWNSTHTMDAMPTGYGTPTGWGTYSIGTVWNNYGGEIILTELGFPCSGPSAVDWVIWNDVGGYSPPSGDPTSADETGQFTPTDTNPGHVPTAYSYIDLTGEDIVIADDAYLCFGYENPGACGLVDDTGFEETWSWYGGAWDEDSLSGANAVLQVKANHTAIQPTSLGVVKAMYK